MFARRVFALGLALCLLEVPAALAAEVESGDVYCFAPEDFSREALLGVCITGVPEKDLGTVLLGERRIRPGDVLTAEQLEHLTFVPARREQDASARIGYLPVFSDAVGQWAEVTVSIRGKANQSPVAEDFAAETYKNLPIEGKLKVKDPEGEAMTFALVRQPKRGQVEIREDGTFTYTPKKNKVGIDSFVYTATDASGKVSRETTVTVTIVKPTDAAQYTDTVGLDCRFTAEWMKNTGIFTGETLDGNACFSPHREVSRGQFLAMLVRTLDIPREAPEAAWAEHAPQWLRPYLAAAVRSGFITDLTGDFEAPISGAEAEAMVRGALDLDWETAAVAGDSAPLTRGEAAKLLYEASLLARDSAALRHLR